MSRAAVGAATLLAAATLVVAACSWHADRRPATSPSTGAPVALIVVDGLDARELTDDDMPALARAWHAARWCPDAHGRAAMPARTNVYHATLATGVTPEAHGITGNAFWGRRDEAPRKLGATPDFATETVFTLAAAATPPLTTALAVGKPKLDLMFAMAAAGQSPPTAMWSPKDAPSADRDPRTGYAFDAATLAGARALLDPHPAFLLVNLADVDRVSHGAGPFAEAARAARRATDAALAAFVDDVLRRPEWREGTIVVTADHGFAAVAHPAVDVAARLRAAGLDGALVTVADGGVAHVYARRPQTTDAADALASARRVALATDGIAEALYLAPNVADGGDAHTLARVHPEWHVVHERTGDLLVVAKTGWVLAESAGDEATLAGNHGGPGELDVPIVVMGGGAREERDCGDLGTADLGATVLHCLGLPPVARLDGAEIPEDARGRVLPGLCAGSARRNAGS